MNIFRRATSPDPHLSSTVAPSKLQGWIRPWQTCNSATVFCKEGISLTADYDNAASLRLDPLSKRINGIRNKEQKLATTAQLLMLILVSDNVSKSSQQWQHKLRSRSGNRIGKVLLLFVDPLDNGPTRRLSNLRLIVV